MQPRVQIFTGYYEDCTLQSTFHEVPLFVQEFYTC
jgi:hypothetical protein